MLTMGDLFNLAHLVLGYNRDVTVGTKPNQISHKWDKSYLKKSRIGPI